MGIPLGILARYLCPRTCQRADGATLPQQLFVSPGKALFFFVLNQKLPTEWKGKSFFFWTTHCKVGHVASRHFSCTTSGPDLTYFNTSYDQMAQMVSDRASIVFNVALCTHQSQSNGSIPSLHLHETPIEPWTAQIKAVSIRRRHLPPPLPIAMPMTTPQAQQLGLDLQTIRPPPPQAYPPGTAQVARTATTTPIAAAGAGATTG